MKRWLFTASALMGVTLKLSAVPCDYEWTGSLNEIWEQSSNWNVLSGTGCSFPNVPGDTALFDQPSTNQTVTLVGPVTLTTLTFDANTNYSVGGGSLTFVSNGITNPIINAFSGNITLNTPISFTAPLTITSNSSEGIGFSAITSNQDLFLEGSESIGFNGPFQARDVYQSQVGATFVFPSFVVNSYTLTNGASFLNNGTLFVANAFNNVSGILIPRTPGDTPGNLTITGNYIQSQDGFLLIQFLNNTNSTLTARTANLDGRLGLYGADLDPQKLYTILTTTNGVTGQFSNIISNLPPDLTPRLIYTPTSVFLSFMSGPDSFSSLSKFVSLHDLAISNINQINYLLFKRLHHLTDPRTCHCGFDAYAGALGSAGTMYAKKDTLGYRFRTGGAILGADFDSKTFGLGTEVDYQRMHANVRDRFGSFDIDQVHGSVYGTCKVGRYLRFDSVIGGGYEWITLHRRTGMNNDLIAKSNPNAYFYDFLGGAEYRAMHDGLELTPFATVQYIHYHQERSQEKQAAMNNYRFFTQKIESVRSCLGARLVKKCWFKHVKMIPSINLAWQHEYSQRKKHFPFVNTTNSLLRGEFDIPEMSRDIALAGIDLEIYLTKNWSAEVNYEFEGSARLLNNFLYLALNGYF